MENENQIETLDLHDYRTGAFIRHLTPAESARYLDIVDSEEGTVDGAEFGETGTVYAM